MRNPLTLCLLPVIFFLHGWKGNTACAQTDHTDSLKLALKNAAQDTTRCKVLFALTESADDDEWPGYNAQLYRLCEEHLKAAAGSSEARFYKGYYADALNNLGYLSNQNGEVAKALASYEKSLKISEELGDQEGAATGFNNIGAIYNHQGDISRALEYYSKSLEIREAVGDQQGIANSFNNLGIVYNNQGDLPKALEYYTKGLKIRETLGDKEGTAIALNNIGSLYDKQGLYDKALANYEKSLHIKESVGDKRGIATSLNNIGRVYSNMGDMAQALQYLEKGLEIREEINDKNGLAFSLQNIAGVYYKQKKYQQALSNIQRSMTLAKALGFPENIRNAADLLSRIYTATGNYKAALENYTLYIAMRDSIRNTENQKASIRRELQYGYDKKAAADSVSNARQAEVHRAQVQQQAAEIRATRNRQYALYGGLALVLVFAGFMYNRFKVTSRQKDIIELKEKETQAQKHIIEEKHREITDSINYAERIQRSFLASKALLDSHLKDYFVLFRPRDVVSGDFYWAAALSNGNFALATADSTGHGVPGAIMSLLNITSLEKAVENHTGPADILNATRQTIIGRLKKDGSPEGGKDGMDASLTVYDFKSSKLWVAAANNPVWIVRNSETIEIRPDKMPVGKHDKDSIAFAQHEFDLQKGDVVYTLTDGFPDQFGGDKGKKFMSKNLRELLQVHAHLPMHEQKQLLENTFNSWVGQLEQVDDVTIIGVRV